MIPKGTVPFGASSVPFGVGLKTTLCPLGCSIYLNYLMVLSSWKSVKQLTRVTLLTMNSISIILGMQANKCALQATPPGENAGILANLNVVPSTWWRYINDIFTIWPRDKERII